MIRDYENFSQKIYDDINHSNLDIGAVYFIMKNIMNDLNNAYIAQLNKEALEESKEETQNEC